MNPGLIKKLKKSILMSKLSKRDQDNLITLFLEASDRDLKTILNLFEKYPEQIEIVNKFYKAKTKAFKNKDKAAWEDILQQEHEFLKRL